MLLEFPPPQQCDLTLLPARSCHSQHAGGRAGEPQCEDIMCPEGSAIVLTSLSLSSLLFHVFMLPRHKKLGSFFKEYCVGFKVM